MLYDQNQKTKQKLIKYLDSLKLEDKKLNYYINVLQHVTNVIKLDILNKNVIEYKENKKFYNNKYK